MNDKTEEITNNAEETPQQGFIYFAQKTAERSGDIKIGFSINLSKTQKAYSYKGIVVLGHIVGNLETQKELHQKFNQHHTTGEWFYASKDLIKYILENRIDKSTLVGTRIISSCGHANNVYVCTLDDIDVQSKNLCIYCLNNQKKEYTVTPIWVNYGESKKVPPAKIIAKRADDAARIACQKNPWKVVSVSWPNTSSSFKSSNQKTYNADGILVHFDPDVKKYVRSRPIMK